MHRGHRPGAVTLAPAGTEAGYRAGEPGNRFDPTAPLPGCQTADVVARGIRAQNSRWTP